MIKTMVSVFLVAVFVGFLASFGYGQCETEVKYTKDSKSPIAVYGLMRDYDTYTNRNYTGKIAQVQYDTDGVQIVGFALELRDGVRKSVDVTHDSCVEEMNKLDRSWLPYIIKKGLRVRVEAEISGSAGFINARNIIILASEKK